MFWYDMKTFRKDPFSRGFATQGVRTLYNKKVLLRERKRHTHRGVSSTPSVNRGGVPPQQAYPPGQVWQGVPEVGYPPGQVQWGGTQGGVPPGQGYPQPGLMGETWGGVPSSGRGTPYPPSRGTPQVQWGVPEVGYPPAGVPPSQVQWGYPRWGTPPPWHGYPAPQVWTNRRMDGWTDACQNITFPRTTYGVGNNFMKVMFEL